MLASGSLDALAGVTDPEEKRKIIGREFIRVFEQAQADLVAESADAGDPIRWLVQGTLYPDVVESGGGAGTANIKSHHNVGGLPDDIEFELIEPLRALFNDEVREIGRQLGLPEEIVGRRPFPGPGLGIRIIGEVTWDRLELLRKADAIARAELSAAGLDNEIWQCPVVLLADVRSVGVQGDGRTYGHPIVLRPVSSEDAMTADWTRLPSRRARTHLEPHHQRGRRRQPRRARRDLEAPGHDRVGVTGMPLDETRVHELRRDFAILSQEVNGHPLVYLDHSGATRSVPLLCWMPSAHSSSCTTPPCTAERTRSLASRPTTTSRRARRWRASWAPDADEISWTLNATDAINSVSIALAKANAAGGAEERIRLAAGDEILITEMEHHANLVPWQELAAATGATLRWIRGR